jgi:hypothetical protein
VPDSLLTILKLCFLALLYLFFARVLWAVWSEVRSANTRATTPSPLVDDRAATVAAPAPEGRRDRRRARPGEGRRGRVARLVIIEPKERRGAAYPLGAEITVGRDPSSTITIDGDTFVSSTHLRIYEVEGQAMVEDLGSTNGSFHNGSRLVGSRLLHPGDRIQVGYTVLEAQ